ncbi:esterase-like activity of phytase family protein [Actibacterium lipolyticum]|uniref:Phytase-like domain-containing protein n=1 Tax=Actibacterium lipolyticum TaxID=1524263 RepID=A0A238KX95_9RHOB|nr:esterase-like activity of phytase family protein [Actibacterium lipolyticum]SMX46686.1 hypothetical protein COL8621_03211 [Actibacterium lipolyticum]
MRARSFLAITLAIITSAIPLAADPEKATLLGEFVWTIEHESFGGFSGLELSKDGRTFTAISDRGAFMTGQFARANGAITGIENLTLTPIKDINGGALPEDITDPEGLAIRSDGRIFISFEGYHRVWTYRDTASEGAWLPRHADFMAMQNNSSLEALAISPDGTLFTLPERSGHKARPFPVYRYRHGTWTQPFTIPRRGDFLPVGADIGPDDRFYLLERDFHGVFGFSTRIRRFTIGPRGFANEQELLVTEVGQHDNLEGISVWRDEAGLVMTLLSDDNFHWAQHTEFVEYRAAE